MAKCQPQGIPMALGIWCRWELRLCQSQQFFCLSSQSPWSQLWPGSVQPEAQCCLSSAASRDSDPAHSIACSISETLLYSHAQAHPTWAFCQLPVSSGSTALPYCSSALGGCCSTFSGTPESLECTQTQRSLLPGPPGICPAGIPLWRLCFSCSCHGALQLPSDRPA